MTALSPSPLGTPLIYVAQPTTGRNAHIFQPPTSPASSTVTPSFATANDYFSSASRKRQRPDSSHGADNRTPWSATPAWPQYPTPSDGSFISATASGCGQNSAMVNDRYRLAGGYDTPSLQATAEMEQLYLNTDRDGRRWRGDRGLDRPSYGESMPVSGPLARERNGVARMQSSPNGEPKIDWTGLTITIVRKVFNFGTNVIRGFYAGGGTGYSLGREPPTETWRSTERCSTPVPGSWQEDADNDFDGNFEQDNPQSPPSRPTVNNKRRQTDRDTWVMVGTPDAAPDSQSPRRKVSSGSIPTRNTLAAPRPAAASRASSRRSLLAPVSRRQTHHISHTGSPAQQVAPHSPSASSSLDRRASYAPMRSSPSRPSSSSSNQNGNVHSNAYISPEAERYVKRRVKQDRQADAAMSDMSRKLADLIRQGQQALGTKVSVEGGGEEEDEEMDEGFVDEEW